MNRITQSILITAALSVSLHAQAAAACSNQSLQGSFAVLISGTRPAPSILPSFGLYLPGALEQVIGVVIQTYDGNGGATQTDNVKGSLSGITLDRAGTGTYTINPDCTGTFTINNPGVPFPIVNRFILADGGKEVLSVVVSPQAVMISSRGRKIN